MQHKKCTDEACVMQKAELIVWDECTMSHRHALEALDRTLKGIRGTSQILEVLLCFCPVTSVRHCRPFLEVQQPDELAACLKSSFLWQHVQIRLIIYGFTSRSRIFHLYGDVTTAGEGLQNLGLCSALTVFEQGGIFIVLHLL
jgi:hypothetical protein